ncbi:MAG: hypothetical protein E7G83_24880 [Klebsiella aerogenes]|nr:hypothetical protein [Klebsiella aerogenes]
MKAHLQVIFTLDELAAYLKVGKRTINDQTRAGAKKEVMRKREQQKSSEQPVSPGRTARHSRQRA